MKLTMAQTEKDTRIIECPFIIIPCYLFLIMTMMIPHGHSFSRTFNHRNRKHGAFLDNVRHGNRHIFETESLLEGFSRISRIFS